MAYRKLVTLLLFALLIPSLGSGKAATAALTLSAGTLPEGEKPDVDGVVNEPVWQEVEPYTGFTQQNPTEGAPASERTEVRITMDNTTVYVGIIAFDSEPGGVLVTDSRRDGDLNETDSIQIVFDTFNDNQNAFLFGTNPVGIEYDGQIASEGETGGTANQAGRGGARRGAVTGWNPNWDGDWVVRSQITERGWETELAIPFKTLRYDAGENRIWGFNVMRNIRRKNEQVYLAPIPRGYNIYRVSLAAKIEQLDLPERNDVKITPYGLGRTTEDNLAATDQRNNDLDVGVDVKWGVTPNLTADFTVNTDFAQVESDEQQINLTRFPLFFPEKRPFFLENASTFSFGAPQEVELFFSRRIGIDGTGVPIPILGGARLSGKVGSFNVGALNMQTQETFAQRSGELVAPASNYSVVRVQRQVGRSNYGGVFVNRVATGTTDPARSNQAFGADANMQVTTNTKVFAFLAGSTTGGGVGTDYAGRVLANYATNWWSGHLGYTQVGDKFDAQVGFVPRRGYRKPQARFFLDYQPKRFDWIRRFSPHVTWNAYYGFDGEIQTSRSHIHFFEIQPQAGGRFGARLDREQDQPTLPFVIYRGADGERVVIPPGLYTWDQWTFDYFGNPSAPVYFNAGYTFGEFYDGDYNSFVVGVNGRVGAKLQAGVEWTHQNIKLPDGDFTTDLIPIRFNYSFTTLWSVSALIQYNSVTADISSNIRVALLDRSGTGLFFVYNDLRNTASFPRYDPETGVEFENVIGRSFVIKYTRLFDF